MDKVKVLNEFFFSQIQGLTIYDHRRQPLGRLKDLALRWNGGVPRITGLKYAKRVQKHIPVELVAYIDRNHIEIMRELQEDRLIPLMPDEIYMGKWLMDKQIIDLKGSKLVRVNDIKLLWIEAGEVRYMVPMAVDIGLRGLARRLGVEFLFKKRENNFVWWQYIQHLEEKTASLQLTSDRQQLSQLHPADLADIMEDLDYKKRTDFIEDLDKEVAVEAFAEMELDTQIEVLEHMDSRQASDLLQEMPPDEAVDVLGELPEEKVDELLDLMAPAEAQEMRTLLDFEEDSAGALMTTDYLGLSPYLTVSQALEQLRLLASEAETIYYLYLLEKDGVLIGVLSLRELILAAPDSLLSDLMTTRVVSVNPDDGQEKVADLVNKYNLLALPVVAEDGKMLGIITMDDVLELLIPDRSSLETFARFLGGKRMARR